MGRKDISAFICASYLVCNRRPNKGLLFGVGAYYIFRNLQGHPFGGGARFTCLWMIGRIQILWEQLAV